MVWLICTLYNNNKIFFRFRYKKLSGFTKETIYKILSKYNKDDDFFLEISVLQQKILSNFLRFRGKIIIMNDIF